MNTLRLRRGGPRASIARAHRSRPGFPCTCAVQGDQQGRAKPLFVQLALEPIWKVGGGRCFHACMHVGFLLLSATNIAIPLRCCPLQAYSACEQGADHAAVLGRMVQGLGLAGVPPRALQHPDARAALRSVLR